jgi:DNA polymerase family A
VSTVLAPIRSDPSAARVCVGGSPQYATLYLADDPDQLARLDDWLSARSGDYLGIDCETNALDPWRHGYRARLVQVSSADESWVVPVDGTPERGAWIARVVRRHPRWVAHYAEKDEAFLCRDPTIGPHDPVRWRDPDPHFSDSQVALAVYDPRTVTTRSKKDRIHPRIPRLRGLKDTSARELGTDVLVRAEAELHARFRELAPVGSRTKTRMLRWGFASISTRDPAYLRYAALDPLMTIRLWQHCRAALEGRGQWDRTLAAAAEQWVVDGATYRGMDVDGAYARWLDGQLAEVIEETGAVLEPYGIAPSGQGPSVGTALNRLGVSSPRRSEDGAQSWDAEALRLVRKRAGMVLGNDEARATDPDGYARVREVDELVGAVQQARAAGKYRSTWVAPMLRTVDHHDGAMHPSVRNIGAVTTRMTCQATETAGPLHSAPKRADNRLRAAVRAPRGWLVVTADLRQGEPFTMAALSGDPEYLADLRSGDINGRLAAETYGDRYVPAEGKVPGTASYLWRQDHKFGWLAACYGARPPKVDQLIGVPGRLQAWRGLYPRFWAYADELNHESVIELDSGHRVPLWDRFWVDDADNLRLRTDERGRPVASRLGLNAKTQGSQSDILRVAIHRHRHYGWHWALRFFLHDELIGMVPAPLAPAYRDFLEWSMTVTFRGVEIGCEASIEGTTWQPQPTDFDRAVLAAVADNEED